MQNKLFASWALTGRARTRGERGKERRRRERRGERDRDDGGKMMRRPSNSDGG